MGEQTMDPGNEREHPVDPEHARLWQEYGALAQRLGVALTGQHAMAQQIGELGLRIGRVEVAQERDSHVLKKVVDEVAENTAITRDIRDILTAGRVIKKAGDGVGWVAKTAAAIGGAGVMAYAGLEWLKAWLKS